MYKPVAVTGILIAIVTALSIRPIEEMNYGYGFLGALTVIGLTAVAIRQLNVIDRKKKRMAQNS